LTWQTAEVIEHLKIDLRPALGIYVENFDVLRYTVSLPDPNLRPARLTDHARCLVRVISFRRKLKVRGFSSRRFHLVSVDSERGGEANVIAARKKNLANRKMPLRSLLHIL